MVTAGDGVPQNPTDVTLSGATAVGYSGTGYKTYWLAYGIQMQWGLITCTTGREGEFIFPISFTTKCLSFTASASIPASYCTITTAKFIAHDMNYGVDYKADAFGLFIGI